MYKRESETMGKHAARYGRTAVLYLLLLPAFAAAATTIDSNKNNDSVHQVKQISNAK